MYQIVIFQIVTKHMHVWRTVKWIWCTSKETRELTSTGYYKAHMHTARCSIKVKLIQKSMEKVKRYCLKNGVYKDWSNLMRLSSWEGLIRLDFIQKILHFGGTFMIGKKYRWNDTFTVVTIGNEMLVHKYYWNRVTYHLS